MSMPQEISKDELLQNFDTFVFDADGVLWTGDVPVPGAADWINFLLKTPGKTVFITTNNCKKTGPIYCFGVGEDLSRDYTNTDFLYEVDISRKVKAVVMSFDLHFSYAKLMKAANYLADPEVEFLPTNGDNTFPGPVKNMILPENGPWIAAIEAASGRKPTAVFGKPHKAMADFLKSRAGNIDPSKTVMFGDRLDTDMMFGNTNGFSTVWMQTGVNTVKDIEEARKNNETSKIPNYTCTFATFKY
ncbi:unnamed protein product [Caenorhabditis angaria]|uniref:Uncharacterized protein n=1 Tax=Caenorhabditis angaria TaxID=860376 RepID=A0A9P1IRC1_9PELO|nr:unnamed protein product [Caenorhabditis angaria]